MTLAAVPAPTLPSNLLKPAEWEIANWKMESPLLQHLFKIPRVSKRIPQDVHPSVTSAAVWVPAPAAADTRLELCIIVSGQLDGGELSSQVFGGKKLKTPFRLSSVHVL